MKKLTGLILVSGSEESDANILYLSGFSAPDRFLFMRSEKREVLVVSAMEKGRAEKVCPAKIEVFTPEELGVLKSEWGHLDRQVLAWVKQDGVERLEVGWEFPLGLCRKLEEAGLEVILKKEAVCPERAIKSAEEIAYLQKSQCAAVAAMDAAVQCILDSKIKPDGRLFFEGKPLTSEKVKQVIHTVLMQHSCLGVGTIVAGGEQAVDPHHRGSGELFAGEAIILDIFPRSEQSGYWGDLTRTVCRGRANEALKNLYFAVEAAQAAALKKVKPGIPVAEVHKTACQVFEDRGFKTEEINGRHVGFIHGTGHGVGLEIHEVPRVGKGKEILQTGHVITIEPGLYYPKLGGIRIEDTVVGTQDGWEYLAECKKKFELLGQ
jgi:Xaa-Pro aminopeptidase